MSTAVVSPAYLTTREAAAYLSLSAKLLELWRVNGKGPKYAKVGSAVRYAVADLDAFMRRHLRESTGGES